jgi:hypothetical protein
MRLAEHMARMGDIRDAYRVSMDRSDGKRPLGRLRHRWEYYIMMDLQEVRWRSMDWIGLARDRNRLWVLVNVVMNFRVLSNAGNFLTG